jgi:hypothetical protein
MVITRRLWRLATVPSSRERIVPAKAVKIVGEASDAVHAAHQAGFVHRDIHPGWILVDDQEAGHVRVKLAAVGMVPALFASDLEKRQWILPCWRRLCLCQWKAVMPTAHFTFLR